MIVGRRPGQPLAVLVGLLCAWAIVRIALWQPPFALAASSVLARIPEAPVLQAGGGATARQDPGSVETVADIGSVLAASGRIRALTLHRDSSVGHSALAASPHSAAFALTRASAAPPGQFASIVSQRGTKSDPAPFPLAGPTRNVFLSANRLSGDAWLLWRAGPSAPGGVPVARYGGSQAGAAVRFSLSSDGHRPALYARTSAALDPLTDRELALGFSARPLPRVPARVQLEMRTRQTGGRVSFAPAVLAVSELAPRRLPLGFVAEPYFAAGYVAGRSATPFVDGAVRVERPLARSGAVEARLGAGAWGGAQDGAAALDIGPQVTVRATLAGRPVTLGLDYRLRVAGDAVPGAGPALTLSTGF
jgi:hypothetical protein